ncbi:DUF1329 domain-containing protein [Undibacterium arcticum]
MIRKSIQLAMVSVAVLSVASQGAWAKVSAEEATKLGKEFTCVGAEKAGNQDATIPAFSGKWLGVPPGINFKGTGVHHPDPYANEKPLFVITAKNMEQYANRLSDGEKALLKKYPDTFRIPLYPSHRDFRYADYACEVARQNALSAELADQGFGVNATSGAVPFPIPKNGLELLWNTLLPTRAWTEVSTNDQAVVYPDGNIAWGRVSTKNLSDYNDPKHRKKRPRAYRRTSIP